MNWGPTRGWSPGAWPLVLGLLGLLVATAASPHPAALVETALVDHPPAEISPAEISPGETAPRKDLPLQRPPEEPTTLVAGYRFGGEITSAVGQGDRFYLTRIGRLDTVDAATLTPIRPPFPIPGAARLYAAADNGLVIAEFASNSNDIEAARLHWLDSAGPFHFRGMYRDIHLPLSGNELRSGVLGHGILYGISQQFGRPSERQVFRIDFRDPDRPRSMALGDAPGQADAVTWRPGVLAFITDEHLHLTSDADTPRTFGRVPLLNGEYRTAAFSEDWLIAGGRTALVVDTSDPTDPTRLGSQVVGGGFEQISWASLAVGEDSAFVRHRTGAVWGAMDIANLPSLSGVSRTVVQGSNGGGAVAAAGRYAAMAAGQAGLAWSDGETWRTVPVLGRPLSLSASSERLWAGDSDGEVWAVDLGSGQGERVLEPSGPDRRPAAVAVVDGAVVSTWGSVVSRGGRIEIVAEAPPHARLSEWSWPVEAPHGIAPEPAVAVAGRRLFVSGPSGSLGEIDVSDLAAPRLVGAASAGGAQSAGLAVSDGIVYSANFDSGLVAFEVPGDGAPSPLGKFDLGSTVFDVASIGGDVFAATREGVVSVSLSPNGELSVVGPFTPGPVIRLHGVDDHLVAVGWGPQGNLVWRLKRDTVASEVRQYTVAAVGRLPYRLDPTAVVAPGGRLFVGYGPAGVWEMRPARSTVVLPSLAVP